MRSTHNLPLPLSDSLFASDSLRDGVTGGGGAGPCDAGGAGLGFGGFDGPLVALLAIAAAEPSFLKNSSRLESN